MPSQKLGMATPSTATVPAARSRMPPRLSAATTPSGMPSIMPSSSAHGNQHQRVGQAVEEGLDRRLLHADRGAEIAVQRLADEDRELRRRASRRGPASGSARARSSAVASSGSIRSTGLPVSRPRKNTIVATMHEQDHALHQAARDVALHGASACSLLPGLLRRAAGCARTRRPARAGRGSPRTGRPSWC